MRQMTETDTRQRRFRLRDQRPLAIEPQQRIPAQTRQAEQRQRDVPQQRVLGEQRDDLISPRQSQMGAAARRQASQLLVEKRHRAGVGFEFAGDEIEQRRLAGAVGADDQAPLARRNDEIEAAGDAQTAEGFLELMDRQRGHGVWPREVGSAAVAGVLARALSKRRMSRVVPGTKPSGMKITIATKIAPSSMFQRVM